MVVVMDLVIDFVVVVQPVGVAVHCRLVALELVEVVFVVVLELELQVEVLVGFLSAVVVGMVVIATMLQRVEVAAVVVVDVV